MFQSESEPYKAWQRFGDRVATKKPKGMIVVSAHWESDVIKGVSSGEGHGSDE